MGEAENERRVMGSIWLELKGTGGSFGLWEMKALDAVVWEVEGSKEEVEGRRVMKEEHGELLGSGVEGIRNMYINRGGGDEGRSWRGV